MKKLLAVMLLCLLMPVVATANAYDMADEPPQEVLAYIAAYKQGYVLEDYCEFRNMPTVPYGFALLRSEEDRVLSIFIEYASEHGMRIWTETSSGVPQHKNPAHFAVPEKGQVFVDPIDESEWVCDGLRFTVYVDDDNKETVQESVTYQFADDGFELDAYTKDIVWHCLLREDYAEYYSSSDGEIGRAYGLIDREITRVEFDRLPKTHEEAEATLFAGEIPIEVYRSARWYFPDWLIEDYAQIDRAEAGSLGLVFLRRGDMHRLAFYAVWEESPYYSDQEILFMIERGLPQGEGTLHFVSERDVEITIALSPFKDSQTHEAQLIFSWREDAFHLSGYRDQETDGWVMVRGDRLEFGDGTADVALLTDMRYVDYAALPKTLAQAKEKPAIVPAIPVAAHPHWKGLTAQVLPMIEGRNHKVYMGPGERFPRSGNGKGTVSTNHWVQVFGRHNGFLMVQYHIDGDRYRIGWIKEPALKKGVSAPELELGFGEQEIMEDCVLTDDPMGSGAAVVELRAGTVVRHLAVLGEEWEYVEATVNGETYWGFVPADCMSHG